MLHETDVPHAVPTITFEGPGVRIPSKHKNRTKFPTWFLQINHPFPSPHPTPMNFFFLFFFFLRTDCSKLRQTMQIDVLLEDGALFRRPQRGSDCG